MKDLLSKEHYCYKLHTLLMKNSAYPLFYSQPPYMVYTRHFCKKKFNPLFCDFSKISTPL